jgi:hypothetical protein
MRRGHPGVHADAAQWIGPAADRDPGLRLDLGRLRLERGVHGADVGDRALHRAPQSRIEVLERGAPLRARHLDRGQLRPVELARHRHQRVVALAAHPLDDRRRALADARIGAGRALAEQPPLLGRQRIDPPDEAQPQVADSVVAHVHLAARRRQRHARLGRRLAQVVRDPGRDELALARLRFFLTLPRHRRHPLSLPPCPSRRTRPAVVGPPYPPRRIRCFTASAVRSASPGFPPHPTP